MQAHFNLGNVYRQCGQLEAAEHCYSMVLQAAPGHWRALLNLSVALAGMGRSSEAHRALRASFKASGALFYFYRFCKIFPPKWTAHSCMAQQSAHVALAGISHVSLEAHRTL